MKTMFRCDFLTMRRDLARFVLMLAALAALPLFLVGNLPWIMLYTGLLLTIMVLQLLLLRDEQRGWARFRLALPLSRAQAVIGRYAFMAAVAATGVAIGAVLYAAVCIAIELAPAYAQTLPRAQPFDGGAFALCAAGGFGWAFVFLGVMLPVVARFGFQKAVRYVPALFMLALFFLPGWGTAAFGSDTLAGPLAQPAALASSPGGALAAAGAMLVAACALYAASCLIALRVYNRRDF